MNILAFDQGTTSSRAILFDSAFQVVSSASHPIGQIYPEAGWVEHDPEELYRSVLLSAADCLWNLDLAPQAVGITNQRETVIVWDRTTGRPIHNAIVWQCRRTAPLCESLKEQGWESTVKKKTGLPLDPYFSATKIAWILDHVPKARERAERGELACGTVDTWLIYRLTGNHLTDVTNASRTQLLDIRTGTWDPELCRLFGVPSSLLPTVVPSSHPFGIIRPLKEVPAFLWGLPILSAIGDQQAALFGQKCFEPGHVKNTYGTGCFTLMNIGTVPVLDDKIITTPAWILGGKITYALEGSVFNAGSSVQWLRDELGIIRTADECSRLAATVDSTGGAVFISAFTGLGAPHWDMYARGGFLGITRGTNRAMLCRAVLEGIGFQVWELMLAMEKAVSRTAADRSNTDTRPQGFCGFPSLLKVDGGASASEFLMQFQADLSGIAVQRPQNIETTAQGAAFMAALTAGQQSVETLAALPDSPAVWQPSMTREEARRRLDTWQKAVAALRRFE